MQERQRSEKINPDQITDGRLTILNNLREYINSAFANSSRSAHQKKKFSDALKVVDCLRFVKVNEAFLRYAFFADKQDASVYSRTHDNKEYVIRDFNGTALDLYIYQDKTQYPNQEQALEMCITAHLGLVKDFEADIEFVTKNKKLDEFINELQYDHTTGCLAKRTARSSKYVAKLKKGLFIFEDLMDAFIAGASHSDEQEVKGDDEEKIKKALIYFSPYLWKHCLYEAEGGTREGIITPDFIVDYMVNILCCEDPRPKTSKAADPHSLRESSSELASGLESKKDSDEESELEAELLDSKPEVSYLIKTSAEALKCIAEERALAKNISAQLDPRAGLAANRTDSLSYHINQLTDPVNYRPIKTLAPGIDRTRYWDPTDGNGYTRSLAPQRGKAKPAGWKFTKKEAATLMPRNGKIRLYNLTDPIFFLFNIDACHLKLSAKTGKPKYVWKGNANSNAKGWVGASNWSRDRANTERSVTLEELRDYLRSFESSETIPNHNELLACFAKEALNAIGTQNNTLFDRLNALRIREMLRGTLGVHLPILISTPEQGARVYTRENQLADLQMASNYSAHSKEGKVLRHLHKTPAKLLELYRQQDLAAKALVNLAQRSEKEALALLLKHREFFMVEEEVEEVKNLALLTALKNKHSRLALKLIQLGAKLDYSESIEKNKKLFWLILESGDQTLIEEALKKPLEQDTLAQAILLAAKQNRPDLLSLLLKLKPTLSLNRWRENGKTALDFSEAQGSQEMVEALKAAGAKKEPQRQLNESRDRSIQTVKAVLLKIVDQLEKIKKTPAEKKALQKVLAYSQVLAGKLQPDGGFPLGLCLESINELRKLLNELLNTESFKTYSKDFYATIHASLIALCYWWPVNKAQNGVYLSPEGKPLRNENRVLTTSGLQLDKDEVRKLFAKNSHPLYPNSAVPIHQRDRSYIAETAGPIYVNKFTPERKGHLAGLCLIISLTLYPIITFILAAALPASGPLSAIVVAAACGGSLIPGLLIGLIVVGLVAYFSPKITLKPDSTNPKIKPLLQRPEIKPASDEKQTPQKSAACEIRRVEENSLSASAANSRRLRNSAACLLMPPPLLGSEVDEDKPLAASAMSVKVY